MLHSMRPSTAITIGVAAATTEALNALALPVMAITVDPDVTRMAAQIYAMAPASPLAILTGPGLGSVVSSLARAQRAAGRIICGYLLGDVPDVVDDLWPDAPVGVITDDPAHTRMAELRGWTTWSPGQVRQAVTELFDRD